MGKLLGKIVLTGGPCAGKTTALSRIEEDLTEKGYHVFIVSETATEEIKGGIKPFGDCAIDIFEFQKYILELQLCKENIYERAANSLPDDKNCVIIYDRGVIDNKAYIGEKLFKNLLDSYGFNELNLLENYDMIIHLVTAADGKKEYYTLANNTARSETPEEAIKLDIKTANAWIGHNNLKIIDNSTEFEEKLNRVLDCVHKLLGNPIPTKNQRKFKIDLTTSNLEFLAKESCTAVDIEQIYLKVDENIEKRLRRKTVNDVNSYYYTEQRKYKNGLSEIVTDKKISEKEYQKIFSENPETSVLHKKRYTFIKNKQYFKLDFFENCDYAILEIEPTNENQEIKIPTELVVTEEVTDDINYQNISIADRNFYFQLKRKLF